MVKVKYGIDENLNATVHIWAEQWEYDDFIKQEDPTITIADCGGAELKNCRFSYACDCGYDCHGGTSFEMSDNRNIFIFHVISECQMDALYDVDFDYVSVEEIEKIVANTWPQTIRVKKFCCGNPEPGWKYCPHCGEVL